MLRPLIILLFILIAAQGRAQIKYDVTGVIKDYFTKEIIQGAQIGTGIQFAVSDPVSGKFVISMIPSHEYILTISAQDYISIRIPVILQDGNVDLGILFLERDITYERSDNLITLTDADLMEDEMTSISSEMLQASKDIFLNRAAFDFGQAFFRIRGYGSEYGQVLLNGIPMNKFINGRPQWNNWGGLNDITRNQEFTHGIQASDHNFGEILGTTYINTRPLGMRKGLRFSTSSSNRTYTGRLMGTYSSGSRSE